MIRTAWSTALVLPLALLAGCAVGPDFSSPAVPGADEKLSLTPLPAQTAAAAVPGGEAQRFLDNAPVSARWWQQYGSPELDARRLVQDEFERRPHDIAFVLARDRLQRG